MKYKRWLWLLLIPLALIGGFVIWASVAAPADAQAIASLASDTIVTVIDAEWLTFNPADAQSNTGLIFYPGARVNYAAYAPLARDIAAEGYLVVIVPMPLNLAIFGTERADAVIARHSEIAQWAIGGHSLGGSMAALYADKHSDTIAGLVLWASYPAESNDLSARSDLAVVSIYGTLDGLATEDKIAASHGLLPADTQWVALEGGNHAQFGAYGPQKGDNPATLSALEQQAQIVTHTVALLESLE